MALKEEEQQREGVDEEACLYKLTGQETKIKEDCV